MFKVELYGRVRRAVRVEGRSERLVALVFGISRETVRKMLRYAVPPGYQRQQPVKRPKLGPWWARSTRFWKKTSGGLRSTGTRRSGFLSSGGPSTHSPAATRS